MNSHSYRTRRRISIIVVNSEGIEAKWLSARGVTAFVLKYRVAHTKRQPGTEMMTNLRDHKVMD
jgi:hypothetical protein